MLLYGPYIDYVASTLGTVAVLAALERRQRTGNGAYLDVSQYECGLLFLAGPLLEYHRSGKIAERSANDDPDAAPHGAYACLGEGWIALSCWSDEEFLQLCGAIDRSDLANDPALATLAGRTTAAAQINDALSAWARDRDAHAAAQVLQSAGVHAHAVNSIADLFTDPQLVSRRHWRRRRHPVIGDQAYCFPAFELSETPGDVTAAGPVLGADNERVFREFLGLSDDEFNALRAKGAMD